MQVLTRDEFRKMDKATIEEIGIPAIVLMENAAQGIYENIVKNGEKFTVICGQGNNGGDGLAIARKLIQSKKEVDIYIIDSGAKKTTEFETNFKILNNITKNIILIKEDFKNWISLKTRFDKADIIIDAIFGIGINKNIQGLYYKVIEIVNKADSEIISVDIPSGLDSDTGKIWGISILANYTYTIEAYKKGFFQNMAKQYLGETKIINIGIPDSIKAKYKGNIEVLDIERYHQMIPKRSVYGYKGDYGRLLILAGSKNLDGAALIVTKAAIKTGTGLTTLMIGDNMERVLYQKPIEAMTITYDEIKKVDGLIEKADIIACGPGLGDGQQQMDMLKKIITKSTCRLVLDADALNFISRNKDMIRFLKGRTIVTPHVGEMARLTGDSIECIEENRINVCMEFSKKNGLITLLKGHYSVISDGNRAVINTSGNSKMASGGMGDCLTGIISSLAGQKISLIDSAVLGCYLHGKASEEASKNKYSVEASEVIEEIQKVMDNI